MRPRAPRTDPFHADQDHPYELHLFICTNGPECPTDGPAMEIRNTLKAKAKEMGLKDRVRVNKAGCLGQCGHGPMMVVHPDNVWYSHLGVEDAVEVFERHVKGEGPVERLRYRLGPGGCKAAREDDGASSCHGTCRGP